MRLVAWINQCQRSNSPPFSLPGRLCSSNSLPGSKRCQMPGVYPWGGGMLKFRFDWFITLYFQFVPELRRCKLFFFFHSFNALCMERYGCTHKTVWQNTEDEWYRFCPMVSSPPLSLPLWTFYFEFASHLPWVKEREINMFCVVCLIVLTMLSFLLVRAERYILSTWQLVESMWERTWQGRTHHGAKPAAAILS